MTMKYLGKFGEYQVLTQLLARNIEAYLAINVNQHSYDITAILESGKVLRIQVKATELDNKVTNNKISKLNKNYDFLVLVVALSDKSSRYFVLTKSEVQGLITVSGDLYTTYKQNNAYCVRKELEVHEAKWEKIQDA